MKTGQGPLCDLDSAALAPLALWSPSSSLRPPNPSAHACISDAGFPPGRAGWRHSPSTQSPRDQDVLTSSPRTCHLGNGDVDTTLLSLLRPRCLHRWVAFCVRPQHQLLSTAAPRVGHSPHCSAHSSGATSCTECVSVGGTQEGLLGPGFACAEQTPPKILLMCGPRGCHPTASPQVALVSALQKMPDTRDRCPSATHSPTSGSVSCAFTSSVQGSYLEGTSFSFPGTDKPGYRGRRR